MGTLVPAGDRLLVDINWKQHGSAPISVDLIQILTAACLVESRGDSYGEYMSRVFADDPEFALQIRQWSTEESEHGIALSKWLSYAQPTFDFAALFQRYNRDIKLSYLNSASTASIRGSKYAELLSRCCVESGTSTYYKAVAAVTSDEPLRTICTRLARDEINHYRLFKKKLDKLRAWQKPKSCFLLWQAIRRLVELEDDQVSYAYYLARSPNQQYDRRYYASLMGRIAFRFYSNERITELIKLNLQAFGIDKTNVFGPTKYRLLTKTLAVALRVYIAVRVLLLNQTINLRRIKYHSMATRFGGKHG
jgi:rubrerythrin